ncbi:MAG: thiolase family protein [Oscillospiraceae bacterium]|nr:thiolase family protein [Oscillospiraceae bacterium]
MEEVVILGGARTPIGDFLGSLKDVQAVDLATTAVTGALKNCAVDAAEVEELVLGMLYKQGAKGNPARQVQIQSGMRAAGWAHTVDQQCASGMRAFESVVRSIQVGTTKIGVAAGVESMSNAPYLLTGARSGYRMGDGKLIDSMLHDGLVCAIAGVHMGVTAENLAKQYHITRQEQDALAVQSHQRAASAIEQGIFVQEIVPVTVMQKRKETIVMRDEHPRADISLEQLAALRPAFVKDGTVTAGNASSVNDGAAALVLASGTTAAKLGCKPMARVVTIANAGVEAEVMGIGPVYSVQKALEQAGLQKDDIGCFEINEAFAAQFIACNRVLKLDMDKVNMNGSGVGLGHPVGCTGARILVSLAFQMRRLGCRYGLASLCVGGGPSMATILELM